MTETAMETTDTMWDTPEGLDAEKMSTIQNAIRGSQETDPTITCVDGRKPALSDTYVQALGGSLNAVSVYHFTKWMGGEQIGYKKAVDDTFAILKTEGLPRGLHTGHHAKEGESTDCGFADKYPEIIQTLGKSGDQIAKLLNAAGQANGLGDLVNEESQELWDTIITTAQEMTEAAAEGSELMTFPASPEVFKRVAAGDEQSEVTLTMLEGEHQEIAAHISMNPKAVLIFDELGDLQTFNLSLGYLREMFAKPGFEQAGVDVEKAQLLTLGLYVATERVLRKDKAPLPVIAS